MASELRMVGSSNGSIHQHMLAAPGAPASENLLLGFEPALPSINVKLLQAVHEGEDDFSQIAEELSKVEAHNQLATVIQKGYYQDVQASVTRLSDTVARISKTSEGEGFSSDDGESMCTAARSLRDKLGSSRIAVEPSAADFGSVASAPDDVMSEYSASHDVDSVYNSVASSRSISTLEVAAVHLDKGKALLTEGDSTQGHMDNSLTHEVEEHGFERGEPSHEVEPCIEVDTAAAVGEEMSEGDIGRQELQQLHPDGRQEYALQECSLTSEERILLRLEELEMKVDFLMNRVRNTEYCVPGFVVLRVPTIDALVMLALTSANAVKSRLVRSMECFWPLRPFVLVVNTMEDLSWALFRKLPIIGVPEKQWI